MNPKIHFKLAVFGNPIAHSLSPGIHEQFAKQFNLSLTYTKIQPELNQFPQAVEQFRKENGYGFNVTIPFKQEAYALADEKSLRAEIAKSVNTMLFKPDGSIFGDNTDGIGLLTDITKNLQYSLKDKMILILGAGGAVRGILEPLLSQSPTTLIIANRTFEKTQQLANEFRSYGNIEARTFADLKNTTVDVIIDGTAFNSDLPLTESLALSANSLCYDLKYSNQPTALMRWGKAKNSKIVTNGLGMLIEQAAEAFYLWTGKKPFAYTHRL